MTTRFCALRGATTVPRDDPAEIGAAVQELVETIMRDNALRPADIVSAIFSATPDLKSAYPAVAARALGWGEVPLLCVSEMAVEGSLGRCVRMIVHVMLKQDRQPRHVYLRDAVVLRPEWTGAR